MKTLATQDGWADKSLQGGRHGLLNIIKHAWASYNIMVTGNLPKDIEQRGMNDRTILPDYPYRDDGTLIWNAIHNYVSTIVGGIYGKYASHPT